jgi:endonuclease-3
MLRIAKIIEEEFSGVVPDDIDLLLELPGVGRKTANLVLIEGYGKEGVCVDTHVHRITNRWGYVDTNTPEETEFALRKNLPKDYWKDINHLLVAYGQGVCRPVSPFCSDCKLSDFCMRKGVLKSR